MSVLDKIQQCYGLLTKTQRKAADYIFQNADLAAMQTSTQICQAAHVSNTTVIRLAYALGFGSFSEMQRQLKGEALQKIAPAAKEPAGVNQMQQILSGEIEILKEMRDGLVDYQQIRGIARRLAEADRIMIFGYYAEHTVSYQLFLLLDSIRPNVYYFRQLEEGYREAMKLTDRSVLIAVSFKPYAPGTLRCIRQMKEYKSYVVSFTDSALCELAREADENVTLKTAADPVTGFNRMGPVMSFFFALFDEVTEVNRERALEYLRRVPSRLVQPRRLGHMTD